jgi:hypothetical protein
VVAQGPGRAPGAGGGGVTLGRGGRRGVEVKMLREFHLADPALSRPPGQLSVVFVYLRYPALSFHPY